MQSNLIATGIQDDPDPEGVDLYGMLPLYAEIEDDGEESEEEEAEREDKKDDKPGLKKTTSLGAGGDDDEPLVNPSSFSIEMPEDEEFTDDDNAYQALTEPGANDMSPGEAQALIDYMRPLSDEELEITKDPLLKDLRWVDDPAHIDDVLKAGKDGHGVDKYLDDATYGESHMPSTSTALAVRPGTNLTTVSPTTALKLRLCQKFIAEHANFLADADLAAGVAVRPRSFYENVSRLWTKSVLRKAGIPWQAPEPTVQAALKQLLVTTQAERSSYSKALSSSGMEGWGWNPISAAKKIGKAAVSVTKKATGTVYKYSGAKFLVTKAQEAALYPIKKVIRSQTNKIVNRRANAVARTQGLAKPTPAMYAQAKVWAKNLVRAKNKVYGPMIAALMGAEYGVQEVDISLGSDMGGVGDFAKLILIGPAAVLNILGSILKMPMKLFTPKGGAAPAPGDAPAPGEGEGEGDPAEGYPDAGAPDAGAPGGYADAGPADAGEPYPEDSAGYGPYPNQWMQPALQQAAFAVSSVSDVPTVPARHPRMGYARRLHRRLVNEHINFLADDDLAKNIPVRPRSYYHNVSRLWARNILRQAGIPWSAPMQTVQAAVQQVLNNTQSVRASYSKALATPYTGTPMVATPYGAPPAASYPVAPGQQYPGAPYVSYPGQPAPYNPYAGRPGGYVPGSDSEDEDFDSSGEDSYVVRTLMQKYPQGVTLEQINQESKQTRQIILALVRQNRIKIRH